MPGTLLGVVPDPDLEDRAVTLEPGDALVFYTDGVIESRGDATVLDERRLAELVATCAGAGADAIAAKVEEAAVLSQGGRPAGRHRRARAPHRGVVSCRGWA